MENMVDGPLSGRELHAVVIRARNGALQGLAATRLDTRIKQQVAGCAHFDNVPLYVLQL